LADGVNDNEWRYAVVLPGVGYEHGGKVNGRGNMDGEHRVRCTDAAGRCLTCQAAAPWHGRSPGAGVTGVNKRRAA